MKYNPADVARKRIVQEFDIHKGGGVIVADGKRFDLQFDDLLDLTQAVEMIMLKLTGKVLRAHLRPDVKSRIGLTPTRIIGGACSLYDGQDAPLKEHEICEVTHQIIRTHYLLVEINGDRYDNWFGRLDELVKCLYSIVRQAQLDPYKPKPTVMARSVSMALH